MKRIQSLDNENIKKIRSLSAKKYREQFALCRIEGEKVIREALALKRVKTLIVDESREADFQDLLNEHDKISLIVSSEVFKSLSAEVTSQGIMAVIELNPVREINANNNLLVLDHLQDPGNLGTIIRSAVASGHEDIILIDSVDPYNDKTLRSTTGTIFYPNFVKMKREEFIEFADFNNLNILIADMNGQNLFDSSNTFGSPYALVIGSEGQGVSAELKKVRHKTISIPMDNKVESLNAGVSASIIMFNLKNKK